MEDIDLSKPGYGMTEETFGQDYNSYAEQDQVADPLDMGVPQDSVASYQPSDKEMNFKALREAAAKLKEEREYWRGQAEAVKSQIPAHNPQSQPQTTESDAYAALDWDDGRDVRKAFDLLRQQNDSLRQELKDVVTATTTKAQHSDWDDMVAQHVPSLTSKNPIFAEMIRNASNPYEAAYLLAQLNAKASQPVPQANADHGQRALSNAQKPRTLASVGGGGTISSADYYANMSDADFMKLAAKHLESI